MCVMEVHVKQHSATMLQACAHNTRTVIGDLEMLEPILLARGIDTARMRDARAFLESACEELLSEFALQVREHTQNIGNIDEEPVGSERAHVHNAEDKAMIEAAFTHTQRAERY